MIKLCKYVWLSLIFLLILLPVSIAHMSSDSHVEFVNVSASGFAPDFLTVEEGTTVVWTVEDGGFYWPASNFHPTHDNYPKGNGCIGSSLDACRGLKMGESYNFTFDEIGRWGLHDHLRSAYTMIIEVVDNSKQDSLSKINTEKGILEMSLYFFGIDKISKYGSYEVPKISANEQAELSASWCKKYNEKFKIVETAECYARQMENISFKYGRDFAYDVLFELQKIDRTTKTCHFIVHGIGWGLYKNEPENWQNLIVESRKECTYAEQMGIIEYVTQNLPNGKITKDFVSELCGINPKANCNHAVGHMMLLETQNNLSKSIDLCYGLKNKDQRYHCLTGTFMEKIAATNLVAHGLAPKDWTYTTMWKRINDFEDLCRSYGGKESVACWREMAHPIAQLHKSDPKKVFKHCNSAPNAEAVWACKTHVIHDLSSPKRFNLNVLRPMCILEGDNDPRFESHCYSALVNIKINSLGLEGSSDVIKFCDSVPPKHSRRCFNSIFRSLKSLKINNKDLKEFCNKFPINYRKPCMNSFPNQDGKNVLNKLVSFGLEIIPIFNFPHNKLKELYNRQVVT